MIENVKTRNEYLCFHAERMFRLLEMGAVVDDKFENELLGLQVDGRATASGVPLMAPGKPISRDVMYSKYDNEDATSHVEVEDVNP